MELISDLPDSGTMKVIGSGESRFISVVHVKTVDFAYDRDAE